MRKMRLKKGETHTKSLKFGAILRSYPNIFTADQDVYEEQHRRNSSASSPRISYYASSDEATTTPYKMSPWNEHSSPYNKSPWSIIPSRTPDNLDDCFGLSQNGLICSLVRGEGHVYSLAVSDDLLYTGSESNSIRVWKNMEEFSGFKSSSGLVKAIVICGDKVFTGHQDGKIRVWKNNRHNPSFHKRVGTLPTVKDFIKTSMNRKNYVEVRRRKRVVWNRHFDAVSCLSLDHDHGLLYSGSWDKTIKVWIISDFECLESIIAHDDAVNSITAAGFCGLVFSGSADGKVKVWRREKEGSSKIKHSLVKVLLKQESAVTSLVVNQSKSSPILYCGSSDGLVNFWELRTAAREKMHLTYGGVLKGHQSAVLCLATGGDLVLSGSADRSICVWKQHEGGFHTCLSVLSGHTGPVKCLAVEEEDEEREGRWMVYSGSLDKSVKVWRVSADLPAAMEFVDNRKDAIKEFVEADGRRFYSMIFKR